MYRQLLYTALSLLALPVFLNAGDTITLKKTDKSLELMRGDVPILTYHTAEVAPPKGVDPAYNRSGFYPSIARSFRWVWSLVFIQTITIITLDFGMHGSIPSSRGRSRTSGIWERRPVLIRHTGVEETRDSGFTVAQEQAAFP